MFITERPFLIQKSIIASAVGCFILVTLIVCIILYNTNKDIDWPPQTPDCPDWWKSIGYCKNQKCINVKKLGSCGQNSMNFNNQVFQGTQGKCSKYTWATNCNISWDGITYGIKNPCNSDSD